MCTKLVKSSHVPDTRLQTPEGQGVFCSYLFSQNLGRSLNILGNVVTWLNNKLVDKSK